MKKMTKKISVFILVCASVLACKKEDDNNSIGTYVEAGSAIVVNEGNFGSSNGSISFIDRNGAATNFIYENANAGLTLGDVIQSYTTVGTKGIICVNNSFKIEIVDARTFKHIATIVDTTATQNTSYVRYALGISESKAYVTNGNFAGEVEVLDLTTNKIVKSINVGKGPEQLAMVGSSVYVCNSGGFDVDSTVSVINAASDVVTATINVGDIPTKIVKDAQNNLWILCAGQSDYSAYPIINKLSPAKLVRINTTTNTVDRSFTLINTGNPSYVVNLAIGNNGRTVYYSVSNRIYELEITDGSLPLTPIITGRDFYGLAASPFSNQIWGLSAPNFTSSGYVFRYTSAGTLIDSVKVGIGPNNIFFNN
jgi:YVTN family beta-propeller protein